jgi:hypothetical protein
MGNVIEEAKIGGHYFLPDQLNYLYCITCLEIVLNKSEQAKHILDEINKCWELPGCKDLIDRVGRSVQSVDFYMKIAVLSGINPMEDNTMKMANSKNVIPSIRKLIHIIVLRKKITLFFNRPKWNNIRKLKNYVDELIKVGFNRESERKRGEYKITAQGSKTLVESIYLQSIMETKDWGIFELFGNLPAITKRKQTYSFEELINNKATKRLHDEFVDAYKNSGFRLKSEETIVKDAYAWCQSRIFCSGIEDYCNKALINGEGEFDPANINKQIKECDIALGYPRSVRNKK